MKISIITATKNSCQTIERAIMSFISQDYRDKELVIVDGNSQDCTHSVLRKFRDYISKFMMESGLGLYAALNMGIKLAEGDIIGILHSDDFFADKQVLTDVANEFLKGADIVYGDVVYIYPDGKIWRYWKSGQFKREKLKFGWMPPHPTFFAKKDLYEKFGYYREDMKISADYELMLRFLKNENLKVSYIPRILTIMQSGGTSNSSLRNILIKVKEDIKAAKEHGFNGYFTVLMKNLRKLNQIFI